MDLSKIVSSLKKKYGTVAIGSEVQDPSDFVDTGNDAMNLALDGGVPFGYFIEFLGFSQSGKSLFIQQILANAKSSLTELQF